MSLKLRDLIRNVRACRTQAEERALVAKECAEIRTSFKNKDDDSLRHRNVAKLLYIHMLGYPAHFGQMEAMKLLATPRFAEKRIGYLALMLLFDENQKLLMLATNCMKNDLHSSNPYICGLALTAIGNIASPAIARDLSLDIIEIMTNSQNNHYIRKKAALTAIRVILRVPELVEDFIQPANDLLNDKHNNVQMCAIQLMSTIIKAAPHLSVPTYRLLIPRLYNILRSTWAMSYNIEYDIMGINDPFLQVTVLRFLRNLCQTTFTVKRNALLDEEEENGANANASITNNEHNDEERIVTIEKIDDHLVDKINELLALVIANIDSTKIPGAAIHYEAILTTLTVSTDQNLRINAIVQLGKFLQSRDNNIRYISLNTMYQVAQQQLLVVSSTNSANKANSAASSALQLRELKQLHHNALSNLEVIQRYRNIIVAYLKDSDPSIRKRALSLIYALVTEKNVRPLVRELLMYLAIPSGSTGGKKEEKTQYKAPSALLALLDKEDKNNETNDSNNGTNGKKSNDSSTQWTNIPGLVSTHLPYAGGSSDSFRTQTSGHSLSSLFTSSTNYEFKCDLTQKIYYIIYQYAPNIVWQIYSMISLLSTENEFVSENIFFEFITLLQNYNKLPSYASQSTSILHFTDHTGKKIQLTKQHIDAFIIYELFYNIVSNHIADRIKYSYLVQAFLFFLPTHLHYLTSPQGFLYAQCVSNFLTQDSTLNAPKPPTPAAGQTPAPASTSALYEPTINYNNKSYYTNPVQYDNVTKLLTIIMDAKHTSETTKQLGLTSIIRLLLILQKEHSKAQQANLSNSDHVTSIETSINSLEYILSIHRCHLNVDLQQRASEYLLLSRNNTTSTQKIIFPPVNYNRTNLDFDIDFDEEQTPSAVPASTAEIDVFAKLNKDFVQEGTETTTVPASAASSNSLDILTNLLAPAPAPATVAIQEQSVASNPFDLLGGTNISAPASVTGQSNDTNFDIMADLMPSSIAPTKNNNDFLMLGGDLQSPTAPSNQTNPSPDDLLASLNNFSIAPAPTLVVTAPPVAPAADNPLSVDPFGDLMSSPVAFSSPQAQSSPVKTAALNNFDLLDSMDFGSPVVSKSAPVVAVVEDDDDFESAVDNTLSQVDEKAEKTIVVYNENGVNVSMTYTTASNQPERNNITYNVLVVVKATNNSINLSNFDFKLAIKAPLTKTIKLPSSRNLSASSTISQELIVVNTSTSATNQTTFKCMFTSMDANGAQFASKPFSVTL